MTTPRQKQGFTLVEMIVVITIIMMLAGVMVVGYAFVNTRKANAKAEVDIAMLSKAIEEYHLDQAIYPGLDVDSPEEGDISEELYQALFLDGYVAQVASDVNGVRIYLPELDPRNSKQSWVERSLEEDVSNEPIKILDPWRRPYRYRKGASAANPDFDLWSIGQDGETDSTDSTRSAPANRDDIRNF